MQRATKARARQARSVRADRVTTTIKREFLAAIVAGTKRIEYREIKPYWTRRLDALRIPFELRLRNGYAKRVPEVTVLIDRIVTNKRARLYALHIREVLSAKYWDSRLQKPTI